MPELSHIKAGLRVIGEHGVVTIEPGFSLQLDPADMLRVGRPKSVKQFFEVNGQSVRWAESLSWADMSTMYLWLRYQHDKQVVIAEHRVLSDVGWFMLLTSTTDPNSTYSTPIRAASMTDAFRMVYDVYLWCGRDVSLSLDHQIQYTFLAEIASSRMGLSPKPMNAASDGLMGVGL